MKKKGQIMVEYIVLFVAVAALTIFAVSNIYRDVKDSVASSTNSTCERIAAGV